MKTIEETILYLEHKLLECTKTMLSTHLGVGAELAKQVCMTRAHAALDTLGFIKEDHEGVRRDWCKLYDEVKKDVKE